MVWQLIGVLLATTAYFSIRYFGFGGGEIQHIPAYLMNMSIATSAVVSVCLFAFSRLRGRKDAAAFWGKATAHLAGIHILLSLVLLSPEYFSKFFDDDGKMKLTGELSFLFGALAAYCYWLIGGTLAASPLRRPVTLLFFILVGGHLVSMGLKGWLDVSGWKGGLPPGTLVAFIFLVVGLAIYLVALKKARDV